MPKIQLSQALKNYVPLAAAGAIAIASIAFIYFLRKKNATQPIKKAWKKTFFLIRKHFRKSEMGQSHWMIRIGNIP